VQTVPEVALRSVGASLYGPVWSFRMHALVALTDDHRLAEVSMPTAAGQPQTRLSSALGSGRNIQISRKDDRQVYLPRPESGSVAVVDLATLHEVDEFDAGPTPAYLAEDAGMRVLLALSADGSSVTPVDQYGYRRLPTAVIAGGPADMIDGANRGREIGYHLYGPSGIRYYKGPSSPAQERGSLSMDFAVAAGDGTDVARSYVASRNDNMLYAVGARRGGEGLEVLAGARLPSPVRELGTDDTRIYAATDREVVVLETASFSGYPSGTIPVVRVINYRADLRGGPVESAPLSGMTIGPNRVYLTLAGKPYVVSVAKPHL
jgi:hypothetical protein